MFEQVLKWLSVCVDEVNTLSTYTQILENIDEPDKFKEIMGDEVNHALIALLTASSLLGLKVPEDGLEKAMAAAFLEGVSDNED